MNRLLVDITPGTRLPPFPCHGMLPRTPLLIGRLIDMLGRRRADTGERSILSVEYAQVDSACVVHFDDMPLPDEILDEAPALFHDVRPVDIDPEAHAPFVIARVLDQGTMRSVAALLRYYGRDRIRRFFREGGIERVSRRTVPLWLAFLNLTRDECTPRSSLHRRSPFWTA